MLCHWQQSAKVERNQTVQVEFFWNGCVVKCWESQFLVSQLPELRSWKVTSADKSKLSRLEAADGKEEMVCCKNSTSQKWIIYLHQTKLRWKLDAITITTYFRVKVLTSSKYCENFRNILLTALLLWSQIRRSQSLCLVSDFPAYCCALGGFPDKWR